MALTATSTILHTVPLNLLSKSSWHTEDCHQCHLFSHSLPLLLLVLGCSCIRRGWEGKGWLWEFLGWILASDVKNGQRPCLWPFVPCVTAWANGSRCEEFKNWKAKWKHLEAISKSYQEFPKHGFQKQSPKWLNSKISKLHRNSWWFPGTKQAQLCNCVWAQWAHSLHLCSNCSSPQIAFWICIWIWNSDFQTWTIVDDFLKDLELETCSKLFQNVRLWNTSPHSIWVDHGVLTLSRRGGYPSC